jgi:hypothetical protein
MKLSQNPGLPIFSFKEDMNLVLYNIYTLIYTLSILYIYIHTDTDIQTYSQTDRHILIYRHQSPKLPLVPISAENKKHAAACLEANRCKAELEAVQSSSSQAEFG